MKPEYQSAIIFILLALLQLTWQHILVEPEDIHKRFGSDIKIEALKVDLEQWKQLNSALRKAFKCPPVQDVSVSQLFAIY